MIEKHVTKPTERKMYESKGMSLTAVVEDRKFASITDLFVKTTASMLDHIERAVGVPFRLGVHLKGGQHALGLLVFPHEDGRNRDYYFLEPNRGLY